jgi:hypothetical protein
MTTTRDISTPRKEQFSSPTPARLGFSFLRLLVRVELLIHQGQRAFLLMPAGPDVDWKELEFRR